MPIIPNYTQQVSPGVANTPDLPHLNLGVGLEATKENANANIELAQTTQKIAGMLAQHAQQQMKFQNEAKVSDLDTQFRQDIQNRLFDETPQTVNIDGQDVIRPTGVLVRQLGQAKGATVDFDQQYQQMRNTYLSQIKNPEYRADLQVGMDSYYSRLRDNVIKHEAKQGHDDLVNSFSSNLNQQIKDSYGAQDPVSLQTSIANVTIAQDKLNRAKALDPETSSNNIQKSILSATENSVLGNLKMTGDTNSAYALLDSAKDKLSLDNYSDIQNKINKIGVQIQAQQTHANTVLQTKTRFDAINQIASGNMNFDNSFDAIRKISISDPKLGEAMTAAISSKGVYQPSSEADDTYSKVVNDIFKAGTQEEVSKFLVNALKENANGNISKDRLAILVNAAMKRADNLPQTNSDGSAMNPAQIAVDSGLRVALNLGKSHKDTEVIENYLKGISIDKSPKDSLDIASQALALKKRPDLSAIPKSGKTMIDKSGNRAIVYADGSIEELNGKKVK